MYITRIFLNNIRGFEDLELSVRDNEDRPRMRTAIIGKNGTRKTTLLRCIAIGLSGRIGDANAMLAEPIGRLITDGKKEATIEIDLAQKNSKAKAEVTTTIKAENEIESVVEHSPVSDVFLAGYGVGRGVQGAVPVRPYRVMDSVYSLFDYETPLISTELSLRRLEDFLGTTKYERASNGIIQALGLEKSVKFHLPKGGGVEILGPSVGGRIPLEGWADGYRITFSWILDVFAWAMRTNALTPSGGIRGILLVDELEEHLHPSMQTRVLSFLSELWPELQIFGTTHSPLVALGALPSEMIILRAENGKITCESDVPDFTGYSAEDMLRDRDLFDSDVYSPEISAKLAEYKELSRKSEKNLSPKEKTRMSSLARQLNSELVVPSAEASIHDEIMKLRQDLGL